jgi:hypothetical protein
MVCPISKQPCPGEPPECRCSRLAQELADLGAVPFLCHGAEDALGRYWLMKNAGSPPRAVVTAWMLATEDSLLGKLAEAIGDESVMTCKNLLNNIRIMDEDATVIVQADPSDVVEIAREPGEAATYVLRHPVCGNDVAHILQDDAAKRARRKTVEFRVPSMDEATDIYWRDRAHRDRIRQTMMGGLDAMVLRHTGIPTAYTPEPHDEDLRVLRLERGTALEK